jgi:D-methionine transport system permease protein
MFSFSADVAILLANSTLETIYMVAVSVLLATVLGIPLGILLMVTDKGQILQNDIINSILGTAPKHFYFSIHSILLLLMQ